MVEAHHPSQQMELPGTYVQKDTIVQRAHPLHSPAHQANTLHQKVMQTVTTVYLDNTAHIPTLLYH